MFLFPQDYKNLFTPYPEYINLYLQMFFQNVLLFSTIPNHFNAWLAEKFRRETDRGAGETNMRVPL